MKRRSLRLVGTGLFIFALIANVTTVSARAASGDLDSTFGVGGLVVTDFGTNSIARAVTVQPDGKLVAVGTAGSGFGFAVARYRADGSLDDAFGTAGKVTTETLGGGSADASAVALQADGKIVVAGTVAPSGFCCQFAVVRYNTDGSLDPSFDGDGRVTTPFGGSTSARGLAIQADGKIIVAGGTFSPSASGLAIARYNANGSLDGTFGTLGKVSFGFGGPFDTANAVAIQADGRIVVAGSGGPLNDFVLARLNSDGSLDPSFGAAGKAITDFGDVDASMSLALQPDGKIVAAGRGRGGRFALARYQPNGALDPTFDLDGMAPAPFTAPVGTANAVAIQSNGKIVVAGSENFDPITFRSMQDIALVRLNPDGTYDSTFGTAGVVHSDFGGADAAYGMVIQMNGMILVAGGTGPGCGGACRFSLMRYLGDPTDATPPLISATASPAANANGWNNTAVTVTWNVSDPESGIVSSTGCGMTTLTAETAETSLTCTAQNGVGLSASSSINVKIDRTAPTVTYTGNAGTYTVDQTIAIACQASDTLSGLATNTCADVARPAFELPLGVTTLTAGASDNAGNSSTASSTVTVAVTPGSLCLLTGQLVQGSAKYAALSPEQRAQVEHLTSVACARISSIAAHLSSAQKAALIREYQKAVDLLAAQGWLSSAQAAILKSLAAAL